MPFPPPAASGEIGQTHGSRCRHRRVGDRLPNLSRRQPLTPAGDGQTGKPTVTQDAAPDAVWDANGAEAPQPTPQHKRGFSVKVYSPKNLGGLREFMSNSSAVNLAMVELYLEYENAPERRNGRMPVVRCEGVLPIKSRHGQNFRPVLRITNWVDPPAALNGKGMSPPVPPQPQSASTPRVPWALPEKPERSSELLNGDIPEF